MKREDKTFPPPEYVNDLIERFLLEGDRWLEHHGFKGAFCINVAWTEDEGNGYLAVGSKVPHDAPAILADSLRASAEEVQDEL